MAGGDSIGHQLSRSRLPELSSWANQLMASVGYRVDFVLLAGSLPYQGSPRREQASNRQSHHQLRLRGLFTSTWDAQAVCCCTCALDESDLPSSSISALSDALQLEPYLHPSPLRGCGGSGFLGHLKSDLCLVRALRTEGFISSGIFHANACLGNPGLIQGVPGIGRAVICCLCSRGRDFESRLLKPPSI